jgi:glycosyltransferase involved in cell wall biosynthesis
MKPAVLYISYDGMLEPLGQSQVLAYLEKLADTYSIQLISFEKKQDRTDDSRMAAMRARLNASGIAWTPLAYHKTPSAPATAYDIAHGTCVAIYLSLRHRVRIVHARSYVPAVMAMTVKRLTGARFIFDMRGFWADERVDGGLWPVDGWLYRLTKKLEARLLVAADHVVTLTHASARELSRFPYLQTSPPPVSIIPTCADLERFSASARAPAEPFVLGYVGSVGTWYLFDEVLECFKLIRDKRPGAKLLIVNRNEHEVIKSAVDRFEIAPGDVELVVADHADVPRHIARMSAGAAIIKPVYSKIASAPTKLAEYLGCGVPCLGNINVGDMESILEDNRVGVAIKDFSAMGRLEAVECLLALVQDNDAAARCASTARRLFSLEIGVEAYRTIYGSLLSVPDAGRASAVPPSSKAAP